MNDYTIRPTYTLDDNSVDYAIGKSILEHDKQCLISHIRVAMAVRPSFKVWSSDAWTPPPNGEIQRHHVMQDAQTLTACALYFAKTINREEIMSGAYIMKFSINSKNNMTKTVTFG